MSKFQPGYRRPSWAHRDRSHEAYTRSDSAIGPPGSRSPDFGPENFSYDPSYLEQWSLPKTLEGAHVALPQLLKIEIHDWALAGAALCTALGRIARLRETAVERGWPRDKSYARLAKIGSGSSPNSASAKSSSGLSSPVDSPVLLPSPVVTGKHASANTSAPTPSSIASCGFSQGIVPPQSTPMGMESPPYSPRGSATPANIPDSAKAVLPDLFKLSTRLPPTLPAPSSGPESPSVLFDENAWETYLNNFRAELMDIRSHALSRFQGYSHSIDKLTTEFAGVTEYQEVISPFETWWMSMKAKMTEYEERVKALRVPNLDDVKHERLQLGIGL